MEQGKKFFSTQAESWGVQTGTKAPENPPRGWTGTCVWQTGDVTCPVEFPNRHYRDECTTYGVTGGGARINSSSCSAECSGQGCVVSCYDTIRSQTDSATNLPETGYCVASTRTTYCCK
ncbi:MAG: hypothetical protein NTZ78_13790 [Candidatus Aureabacteria bacterium]|nr:hypothetical protein [Candidatus Auribacterota bacterium]